MIPILGYEGVYSISQNGEIYSHIKNKFISQNLSRGYKSVSLYKGDGNCNYKKHYVHRLVAINYISNLFNKPQVNHIDGNKINNHVSNLEWSSAKENSIHAYKNNLRKYNESNIRKIKTSEKTRKFTEEQVLEIRNLLKQGLKQKDLSKKYSVCRQTIASVSKNNYFNAINQ